MKAGAKPRKVFDPTKMRTSGDPEMAKFAKAALKKDAVPAAPIPGKRDWRVEHENFVAAMRAARNAKKLGAAAPPPPPSIPDPSFIPCPHCGRRFNQTAAERHIPNCANTINRPKPPPSRGSAGSGAGLLRTAMPVGSPASPSGIPRPKTGGSTRPGGAPSPASHSPAAAAPAAAAAGSGTARPKTGGHSARSATGATPRAHFANDDDGEEGVDFGAPPKRNTGFSLGKGSTGGGGGGGAGGAHPPSATRPTPSSSAQPRPPAEGASSGSVKKFCEDCGSK